MDSNTPIGKIWDRLQLTGKVFRESPFDGRALQTLVQGEAPTDGKTAPLSPPIQCQQEAPITVAQYVSYANPHLPSYWFGVVPDIVENYGMKIRYEHHDVPNSSPAATSYKLATLGRAVQDEYGDPTFWNWFEQLMQDGVNNIEEGYELSNRIEISSSDRNTQHSTTDLNNQIDIERLRTAVNQDQYANIIENDIHTLESRGYNTDNKARDQYHPTKEQALFAVFINGNPVQPSYEAITDRIESMRYGPV